MILRGFPIGQDEVEIMLNTMRHELQVSSPSSATAHISGRFTHTIEEKEVEDGLFFSKHQKSKVKN